MGEALLEKELKTDEQSQLETVEKQQLPAQQRDGVISGEFRGEAWFKEYWRSILPEDARHEVEACLQEDAREHKGETGYEPNVLNYVTTYLSSDGRHWCLVITEEEREKLIAETESVWSPHEVGDQPRT